MPTESNGNCGGSIVTSSNPDPSVITFALASSEYTVHSMDIRREAVYTITMTATILNGRSNSVSFSLTIINPCHNPPHST